MSWRKGQKSASLYGGTENPTFGFLTRDLRVMSSEKDLQFAQIGRD